MTDQEFFHWLKGYIEVSSCTSIGEVQTAIIKDKLQSVFVKETNTPPKTSIVGQGIVGTPYVTMTSQTVSPDYIVGT
jgi:hypothetical protein